MRISELAECYEKNAAELTRFAATLVGASDADDIVSAAVLGVLNGRSAQIVDLRAYLYQAVLNSSRKHWRTIDRRTRREALTFDVPTEPNDPRPEIARTLSLLSPQQRAVIHLTYWEDQTPSSVAARLGVGEGTVRRQLARARHKLAGSLNGQ